MEREGEGRQKNLHPPLPHRRTCGGQPQEGERHSPLRHLNEAVSIVNGLPCCPAMYIPKAGEGHKNPKEDIPHFEGAMAGKSRQVWGENDKLESELRGWQ